MNSTVNPAVPRPDVEERKAITDAGITVTRQDSDLQTKEDGQAGVQQVEAIATVWKTSLIVAYVLIWIVSFAMLMQQNTSASLTPYVASAFLLHSLTPTVSVLSNVIGGVCNLTIAKILDIFGRPQGYAFSLLITTIGLIMMAATNTVEMYAAAQVFWTVGNNALLYTVGIFVADTTTLHNRALMAGLASSPTIATIWLGGPISEGFLNGAGWKWCYGLLCIIIPVLCLPLFGLLVWNSSKAKKAGILVVDRSNRTIWQPFIHYCREFDAIGLVLITVGLALFILPFNLYSMQADGWRSPLIICLLVFGIVAIWQDIFPKRLAQYLPIEAQGNLLMIYGSIDVQISYPVGSPARIAIQRAYADAQEMMLTTGTAIWALGIVGVMLWRNTDVRTLNQVKGNVI
ncbi:hypothetical protein BJX70DRAFT_402413 [Aspergillus crustosus]